MGRGADIVREWEDESLESARASAEDTEPVGIGRAVVQGALVKGTAAIGGMSDLANKLNPFVWITGKTPLEMAGLPSGADLAAWPGKKLLEASGYPYREPTDATGRVTEDAVAGAVSALPFAPFGGAGGLASRALSTAISGGSGGLASGVAREAGAPPLAQVAAGIAGGLSPGAAKYAIGKLDSMGPAYLSRALQKGSESYADRLGMARAGQMFSRATGGASDDVIGALDDEIRSTMPGRATTSQALAETRPGVLGLEGAMVKKGSGGLESRLAGVRAANETALDDAGEALVRGDPRQLIPGFEHARDASNASVNAAYSAFNDSGTVVPTTTLKSTAQAIRNEAGPEGARHLPKSVLANVDEYGDAVDATTLKRLREAINDDISVAEPGSRESRHLATMKRAVDATLDDVVEHGGGDDVTALRSAIAERRTHGDIFGREHPSTKALEKYEDPIAAMNAIARAPKPIEEVRRLQRAIAKDDKAVDGLKRAFWQRALGAKSVDDVAMLSDASTKTALAFLRNNRGVAKQILGDEAASMAERLLARKAQLTFGRGGTSGFSQSTGSSIPLLDDLMSAGASGARAARGPIGLAGQYVFGKLDDALGDRAGEAATRLLEDALIDPKAARDLLIHVRQDDMARWASRMDKRINKTLADFAQWSAPRATAGALGGATAAGSHPDTEAAR